MIVQANCSITTSCSVVSKAINIQKVKSSISNISALIGNGYKNSYLKPNIATSSIIVLAKTKTFSTAKCNMSSKSNLDCYYHDRDIQLALKSYIPPCLLEINAFNETLRVQGNEITKYNAFLNDISLQRFIDTATWGLDLLEKDLGITTNVLLSREARRKKIKFKLDLNNTVITKDFFKSIMDDYYTCDIDEDFINSKINITIIGKRGVPAEMSEMMKDAEELLPGHLDYGFIYTYLPWDELDAANLNFNEIGNYTWNELETAFL